ncbi:MAG: hypothetical protein U0840_08790 [Gemmataceae bacterium]
MPSWTPKDERQFEHIRENELARGTKEERASEIAARTVNKQRRTENRTPSNRTQGTGNPRRRFEERTVDELRNLAQQRRIAGAATMSQAELIDALRARRR